MSIIGVGLGLAKVGVGLIGDLFGGDSAADIARRDHVLQDRNNVIIGKGKYPIAILYNHPEKNGGAIVFTEPTNLSDFFIHGTNWHDTISSIEVDTGVKVEFFEHPNFGGLKDSITGGTMQGSYGTRKGTLNFVNLYQDWPYWNDRISSVKVSLTPAYKNPSNISFKPTTDPAKEDIDISVNNKPITTTVGYTGNQTGVPSSGYTGTNTTNTKQTTESNNMFMWVIVGIISFFIIKK
ncbi:MAG: hypothetical protein JNL75_11175 [Chitinophagales bacterium]|nr:hypothetical protein [Chitinophagales bacterium]